MFKDRYDAAFQLVKDLDEYRDKKDAIILAIPRGALQIGKVLHEELHIPLDIIVTKKIPHPMSEEYAIGAVGPEGEHFVNPEHMRMSKEYIDGQVKRLSALVDEKYRRYRGERPKPDLEGKIVIIVDDGIATGSTLLAAVHVIRKKNPSKIVVAVPVGPPESIARIEEAADEVICLDVPVPFFAIGAFYADFPQVEDDEAIAILKKCQEM